jgi:hypothetical protein
MGGQLFYAPWWDVVRNYNTPGGLPVLIGNTPVTAVPNIGQPVSSNVSGSGSPADMSAQGLAELAALHGTLLSNLSDIATGVGGTAVRELPTSVQDRPWINPPDGSVPYDAADSQPLPAVGSTVVIVSFTVPDGYDGVINAYSWNFVGGGFTEASGDIIAQVLRGSAAIRNYDNIKVQKGTVGIPRNISPIRVFSKQVISIVINHAANALLNGDVVGSLVGYFYPSKS